MIIQTFVHCISLKVSLAVATQSFSSLLPSSDLCSIKTASCLSKHLKFKIKITCRVERHQSCLKELRNL